MIIREHEVPYGLGTVVVRDYGGDGPDVLLVHAPGFCAAAWDNVAESLKGDVHAYAIDLPGHGRSTAPMRRAYDAWKSILAVTEHLGLTNPLLVGLKPGDALLPRRDGRGTRRLLRRHRSRRSLRAQHRERRR